MLQSTKTPIWRATYHCAQACCRDLEAEDDDEVAERERAGSSDGSESTEDESEGDEEREEGKPKRQRPSKANRACNVILHVRRHYSV